MCALSFKDLGNIHIEDLGTFHDEGIGEVKLAFFKLSVILHRNLGFLGHFLTCKSANVAHLTYSLCYFFQRFHCFCRHFFKSSF